METHFLNYLDFCEIFSPVETINYIKGKSTRLFLFLICHNSHIFAHSRFNQKQDSLIDSIIEFDRRFGL